jgi:hypothetical protein
LSATRVMERAERDTKTLLRDSINLRSTIHRLRLFFAESEREEMKNTVCVDSLKMCVESRIDLFGELLWRLVNCVGDSTTQKSHPTQKMNNIFSVNLSRWSMLKLFLRLNVKIKLFFELANQVFVNFVQHSIRTPGFLNYCRLSSIRTKNLSIYHQLNSLVAKQNNWQNRVNLMLLK